MDSHVVDDEIMLSVVLAAFNEEECIEEELGIVCNALTDAKIDYEVIVVDDGSTDETARLVRGFGHSKVSLIQHKFNIACQRSISICINSIIRKSRLAKDLSQHKLS